jgi:hypothetical protein
MKKINLLFILVFILAFIASILIFGKIFLYHPKKISSPTPTPTPTHFSLPTPTLNEGKGDSPLEILSSLKKNFPLVEFLPYETENFYLDYIAPLHLRAKIKKATISTQIKQEILNWINSKGIDPQTHKIDFIPEP